MPIAQEKCCTFNEDCKFNKLKLTYCKKARIDFKMYTK